MYNEEDLAVLAATIAVEAFDRRGEGNAADRRLLWTEIYEKCGGGFSRGWDVDYDRGTTSGQIVKYMEETHS